MSERRSPAPARLRVDPVACDGVGMCAHLAPRLIVLDMWGYPIVTDSLSRPADVRAARAAIAGCPRRALMMEATSATETGRAAEPPGRGTGTASPPADGSSTTWRTWHPNRAT